VIERLAIPEVYTIARRVHRDERGSFCETWRADVMAEAGFERPLVQENLVRTHKRGVLTGAIFDVVVDIRPGSPTLGRWVAVTLTEDEPKLLMAPRGFAHGYLTLTDDCWVTYKTSAYYAPQAEGGIGWNDPALAIDWPLTAEEISVNARDGAWPSFAEVVASLS
jgi:dTDP-4-dehydrorhamnose 3,5-epimerase